MLRYFVYVLIFAIEAVTSVHSQFYYGLVQQFGKNRVQYNQFEWGFYRFDRFDIYTYADNTLYPQAVANLVFRNLKELEVILEVNLEGRFQVILFNTHGDRLQSNLNPDINQPANSTRVILQGRQTTLLLHFTGSYQTLEQEIRAGLARLLLHYQMFGDLQPAGIDLMRIHFPDWFTEGLISYLAYGNDEQISWQILELHARNAFRRINTLDADLARLAGHGLWSYIGLNYGRGVIKNILFTSLIHRSLDYGIEYVLGISTKELIKRWKLSNDKWLNDLENYSLPTQSTALLKLRSHHSITALDPNPSFNQLAIASIKRGKRYIHLYSFKTGKKKRLYTSGHRSYEPPDHQLPIPVWNPSLPILLIIDEKNGFIRLNFYDFEEKKWTKKPLYGVTKIFSASYSPDGQKLLLSAMKDGRTDILEYDIRNTSLKNITSDIHTDLFPIYLSGNDWIAVSTNRTQPPQPSKEPHPDLRPENLQIFHRTQEEKTTLLLASDNKSGRPHKLKRGTLIYPEWSQNLTTTFTLATLDSAVTRVDTTIHYRYYTNTTPLAELPGIISHYAPGPDSSTLILSITDRKGRPQIILQTIPDNTSKTNLQPSKTLQVSDTPQTITGIRTKVRTPLYEFYIDDYEFDPRLIDKYRPTGKSRPAAPTQLQAPSILSKIQPLARKQEEVKLPPRRPYLLSFYRDHLSFNLDNAFLIPQYQPFTGRPQPQLLNPQINAMTRITVADVLKDYKLLLGFRAELNPLAGRSLSPNHELLLWFGNHKKRWKHEYTLYRRSMVVTGNQPVWLRYLTHEGQYKAIFPIDEVRSIHLSPSYRLDTRIALAREANSLQQPTEYQHFAILRASFVHDESLSRGINLWTGFRYKIFSEYYRNPLRTGSGLFTAGLDFRHYLPTGRSAIWANRLALGTSFGPERLLHFLGGVDNNFTPKFDENTPIATTQQYIFQTLVTNMRGFFQNARNGNNFALINSELRLPIFRMLLQRPIRNNFISNFQLLLFSDVGTAWNGISPLSPENAINTTIIDQGNLRIIIDSRKDPLIASIGAGMRLVLFGHIVRIDYARGIEDYTLLPGMFHISIGFDF